MKGACRVGIVITLAVIILIVAVIGGRYIYNNYIRKDHGPILKEPKEGEGVKILFLHHSTGRVIWDGGVPEWFEERNPINSSHYLITEQDFPKMSPYGWNNYPYDYWNIWVNHGSPGDFKREPTLEMITEKYDVVIFKHCFPVGDILPDTGDPDVASPEKRIENYKLQYEALKEKMREFPDKKFIVWTGAALVENKTNPEKAQRTRDFFEWVIGTWDEKGDNIFIWDFYDLETEGGLYLKNEYSRSESDSHPNDQFAKNTAPLLCSRIVDIVEGYGDTGSILGMK